jgi:hypothetical protein
MRARVAAVGLVLLTALTAAQSPPADVPTPESAFGFRPGADRELADWPAIERYVRDVAAASPRVRLVDVGPTTEGRSVLAAVISAPENLARLEDIRLTALRLADPRTLAPDDASRLADRQPAVLAIGMSIHATEVGGSQTAPALLQWLATSKDRELEQALRDLVVILIPSLNPDGLVRTVDWYRQSKGTEFEGAPMPWLDHPYAGHDINRDAFMLNLAETRALADFFYRRWHPQVFLTVHQMGQRGPRYFVPPTTDPIGPNYDPLVWRTAGLLGHAMALGMEQDGLTGIVQNALFDYYSPGYEDSAPLGHNTVTLLAEAASARLATPLTVEPNELEDARGFLAPGPSVAYLNPWPGGVWRLGDVVTYNLSAVRALVGAVARYRGEIVRNFYRLGQRQVELGLKGGPFAYVIPPEQFDRLATRKLRQLLIDGGVEVRRALEPFRVAETVYPAGTDLVLMAQPFRAYALTLLERQRYPARRNADGDPERPYDVTGWTLPLQMHVDVDRIDQYFEPPSTTRLERATVEPERLWGDTRNVAYYVIDGRGSGAGLAVNRLLNAGVRVAWATTPLALQGFTYEEGALVVTESRGAGAVVQAIARDLGLRATAAAGRPPQSVRPIGRARTAVYRSWVADPDEGWTRWLLQQYEFPFETIADADLRRGGLGARFDAVVLPSQDADRLLTGNASGTVPPPYAGGLGMEGAQALKQFVDGGGTLVALGASADLAVSVLGAPLTNVTRGVGAREFFCPGSLVRLDLDRDVLTYGLPRQTAAFFAFSGAFDLDAPSSALPEAVAGSTTVKIVGRYAKDDLLLSGWLDGPRVIAGRGAVLEVRSGQGRAVLLAFRAQHRGQSFATFKLLFNAIHSAGSATSRAR